MPCSIHNLLIINEFHYFWMICVIRRMHAKAEHKWAQCGADRPPCGRPASHLVQMLRHWSRGEETQGTLILTVNPMTVWSTDIERPHLGLKGPPAWPLQLNSPGFLHNRPKDEIKAAHKKVGAIWQPSRADRPWWGRPAPLCHTSRASSSCMPSKGS